MGLLGDVGALAGPPVLVVVGPTAAGKSAVAESVADAVDAEIVSADALQVYRGLDIGTAKPDAAVRARIPHHCVDVLEPTERCSAGRYARMGRRALAEIGARGRPALVVGGSGLYVEALLEGLHPLPRAAPGWREALTAVGHRRGAGYLYAMLCRLDPARAAELGEGDTRRLQRALEIVLRTGRPVSVLLESDEARPFQPPGDIAWVGVTRARGDLRRRIAERVDVMLSAGWVDEVRRLLDRGLDDRSHALQAIGYRELVAHLRDEIDLDEARDRIVRSTRRYAKRQLTWFRNRTQAEWIQLETADGERSEAAVVAGIVSRLAC